MKGGKQIKSQNMPIDKNSIHSLNEEEAQKYLSIDENGDIKHSVMKEKIGQRILLHSMSHSQIRIEF